VALFFGGITQVRLISAPQYLHDFGNALIWTALADAFGFGEKMTVGLVMPGTSARNAAIAGSPMPLVKA
jgi:hypothetical protein